MSDNFWNDGIESNETEETNPMRVLREKAEADSRLIREMSEQIAALAARVAADDMAKTVESKKLPPKVAALAKAAGVKDQAGLDTFLSEYGDVFAAPSSGTTAPGDEQPPEVEDGVPAEEQGALSTMAAASQGATPVTGLEAVEAKMQEIDDPEEFLKFLQSQG